jgi:cyclopropane-fatty-acyl-phospholipid synthase
LRAVNLRGVLQHPDGHRIERAIVHHLLDRARGGVLELREPDGTVVRLGKEGAGAPLHAVLEVRSLELYRRLLRGSAGLAEAYMQGLWTSPDLVALVRLGARNGEAMDRPRRWLRPLVGPARALGRARNTIARSRKQISAHYDLGNDLFALFLDERMMYSSAIFPRADATLEEASLHKLDTVCRKLALTPSDHLLEIGTGWGALAVHAASEYGCRVTTATISREQHDHAVTRVRAAGLSDRVDIVLRDYRELRGRYDKLVSIEMIEAVGWRDFGTFFARCSELLAPDGLMLLQAITTSDRTYHVEKGNRSFMATHIFPGGCLPSSKVIARCVARCTDMRTVAAHDITAHYAETLRRWRARFDARRDDLPALGYDGRFARLWELYLAYCEAGFRERRIRDVQVLLAKPRWQAQAPAIAVRTDALDAALGRRERAVIATPVSATAPPTAVIADSGAPEATAAREPPARAATGGTA